MPENPLELLMNPRSIAVVGASNNLMKMGTIQALSIIKDGYSGRFYPLHPSEKTVLGYQAYARPEDLPEAPDLVLFIVPVGVLFPLLESFGRIGTKRAVVVTGGFREAGGENGVILEQKLGKIAAKYGMRFIGPNCIGIINSQIHLNSTICGIAKKPGSLGLASQSGTFVTQTLPLLKKRGIRFSKAISLGNEVNINIADALEFLGEDSSTKAIILYIEGLRNGRRFLEAARRVTPRKPVLALYVGGTAAGARAGFSHSGAMAGPDFLYAGVFKQAGVIRVDTVEDLYTHGWAMATQPPVRGPRVGIVTNSGGPATVISSSCDAAGLEVPKFSGKLQKKIQDLIQAHASGANPVDMTFDIDMRKFVVTIPEIVMKSGEVDALIMHGVMRSGFLREVYDHARDMMGSIAFDAFMKELGPVIEEIFSLPRRYKKPLLVSTFLDRDDDYTAAFMDHDIPVFFSPEKVAQALAVLYKYKKIKERRRNGESKMPSVDAGAAEIIRAARKRKQKALDEHAAKQVLAAYGVPVTDEVLVRTERDAITAAAKIGYPVALKACSPQIMHKSGKGLIALNISDDAGLKTAFNNIRRSAGCAVPVLVQEMIAGSRELLVGMTRFAGFGPCVIFGLGGVFTEAYRDTTIRVAPLSGRDAREMLNDIRSSDVLGNFRGMPQVKTAGLAAILRTVGNIALLHPEIAEIDLNPVIIDGSDPVVADALIVVGEKSAD